MNPWDAIGNEIKYRFGTEDAWTGKAKPGVTGTFEPNLIQRALGVTAEDRKSAYYEGKLLRERAKPGSKVQETEAALGRKITRDELQKPIELNKTLETKKINNELDALEGHVIGSREGKSDIELIEMRDRAIIARNNYLQDTSPQGKRDIEDRDIKIKNEEADRRIASERYQTNLELMLEERETRDRNRFDDKAEARREARFRRADAHDARTQQLQISQMQVDAQKAMHQLEIDAKNEAREEDKINNLVASLTTLSQAFLV